LAIHTKGKKALHAVIFILFGIFLFFLFLYISFPYETLKMRIIAELEARTPFQYEIEELRPHPPSGLTFKNVTIYAVVNSRRVEVLIVERLRITLSLLPLLWREIYLRLWGKMVEGTLDGDFSKREGRRELALSGRDMSLGRIPIFREATGLEMAGILQGKAMIALREGDISGQSGSAEFLISEATLTRVPLPGIAPVRMGRIQGNMDLKLGRVIIKRLACSGGDFNGQVLGNILLASPLLKSRLNLRVTIKPAAKLDPKYRVFFSLLGRQGKIKESYAFPVRGTLDHPRLVTR
jgi:type II secretion system protein N